MLCVCSWPLLSSRQLHILAVSINTRVCAGNPNQPRASFTNKDVQGAQLFYEDTFWDKFEPGISACHVLDTHRYVQRVSQRACCFDTLRAGTTLNVNTFPGHGWNVRVNGQKVKRWVMNADAVQRYTLESATLQ